MTFELSTNPDDSSDNTGKLTTTEDWWDTAEISLDVPIQIATGADNRVSVRFTHQMMILTGVC